MIRFAGTSTVVAMVLLFSADCFASEPSSAADKAAPSHAASSRGAIKSARLRQNDAIANHRVDEAASYWTDDVTICRGLGLQLAGKAAYRKLFEDDNPRSPDQIV